MADTGLDYKKIKNYFNGVHNEKEAKYIEEVFCDNSREKELKCFLSKQFDGLSPEDDIKNKNLDNILYKIHYDRNTRLAEQNRSVFDSVLKWSLRIAGVAVLPLILYFGISNLRENSLKKETWVELKAPAWTRAQFSLPDGTTGWLNSNSSIKYNGKFVTDRQISLNGEAYFDVFKDKSRPFIVSANEIKVKVLGTRFNIASYENEKNIEVVLEEGKLILSNKGMDKSYTMNPNDLIIFDKNLGNFSTEEVEPKKYLSWTEGKLVFRNDPLDVIARRLERWYNIEVEINDSVSNDLRLRATFVDEDLIEVLNLLKRSLPIDYKIENRDLRPDEAYTKKKVIITLNGK